MAALQRIHRVTAFAMTLVVALALATAPFSAQAQEATDAPSNSSAPTTDATTGDDAASGTTSDATSTVTSDSAADSAEAKSGTVTVEFLDTAGNKITTKDGGKVALYRIATLDSSSGTPRFDFAQGDFANSQTIKVIASMSEKELMDQSEKISASLAEELGKGSFQPFATAVIESSEARFASVPEGLYLVCQSATANGDKEMAAFMVSVPDEDGSYDVVARPKPSSDKDEDTKKDETSSSSSSPTSSDVIHTDQNGRTTISTGDGSGVRAPTSATGDASPLWIPVLACGLAGIAAGANLVRQNDES